MWTRPSQGLHVRAVRECSCRPSASGRFRASESACADKTWSVLRAGPKTTLEDFAAGAVYEYDVHHEGYVQTKAATAEEGFHAFLRDITRHLLILR